MPRRTRTDARFRPRRPEHCEPRTLPSTLPAPNLADLYAVPFVRALAPGVGNFSTPVTGAADPAVTTASVYPLTPARIRTAYAINAIGATGAGATIAIVDAYNHPNIVSDLNAFDRAYSATTGGRTLYSAFGDASSFFTVVSQTGSTTALPANDAGWALEIALDVEWAHAIAPGAKLILVEANSSSYADLFAADAQAVTLGANVISNSWGSGEFDGESWYDSSFATRGVTYVFSAGDSGNQSYPAASPNVVSVGGTSLSVDAGGNWTGETTWSNGGGGVSAYENKPSYQSAAVTGAKRSTPDVSYDGDPYTGFSVYTTYGGSGWTQIGGTSAGAPQWAGLIALADGARLSAGRPALDGISQTLPTLYSLAAGPSATTPLFDVVSGANAVASAHAGYDSATGLGTPRRADLVNAALVAATSPTATTLSASPAGTTSGQPVTLTVNVANLYDSATPTGGTVTFRDGSTALGTATLVNGTASFTTSALGAGSHPLTASYAGDGANFSPSTSSPVTVNISGPPVTFVAADTATQGGWKGVYGGTGYVVAQDAAGGTSLPPYASVALAGQSDFTWAASTLDPRALYKAGSATDRLMAGWYSPAAFSLDVRLADAAPHQLAVYAVDPDSAAGGRSQRVDLVDDATGLVLDTRSLASFQNGVYLVWNVTGSVSVRVTNTNPAAGANAVINGLFLGGAAASPAASASFVKTDAATQGGWKSAYGSGGYVVAQDAAGGTSLPPYASVALAGQSDFTWAASTLDPRALYKAGSATDRLMAGWYSPAAFSLDVRLADAAPHQLAVYAVDPDSAAGGRSQRVDLVDDATGLVLDTRSLASFQNGVYLVWNVTGSVSVRVTNTNPAAGANAVINGLFLGGAAASPAASASFVKTDAATQGAWKSAYGSGGYVVAQDAAGGTSLPPYASVALAGQSDFTWAASTLDPRALYKAGSATDRLMAGWYSPAAFSLDVRLADAAPHQLAVYAVDPDSAAGGRSQRVDLVDDATGLVLDTRSLASFQNGVYLVWNVTGSVSVRVTNTNPAAGANAVINGLFLDGGSVSPAASVSFLKTDAATQGSWKTVYGSAGADVAQDPSGGPVLSPTASVAVAGQYNFTWASSTTDARALQQTNSPTDRVIGAWYSPDSFTIDVRFTDGAPHRLAIYALDPDAAAGGRAEQFTLLDDATGKPLDTRSLASFGNGTYLVWNVTGNVTVRVTNTNPAAGANAVVNGVFID